MSDDFDDLIARAQDNAERGGVPADAGELLEIEIGETFTGRHRGHEPDWGKSGARLGWDDAGEPVFIWDCYSLTEEYEREQPNLGDRIAIHRRPNYKTQFDAEGDARGRKYGLACEPCDEPLPGQDGIPF
jgi:hypothetical protein